MELRTFGISPYFDGRSVAAASLGGALLGATVIFKTMMSGNVLAVSGSTRTCMADWRSWDKATFLVGLSISGPAMAATYGGFEPMPPISVSSRELLLVRLFFGGLMIGAGTAFGGGCTSGHGLTGLARLSMRSWVAVPTFMFFGMVAASLTSVADALPPDVATEVQTPDWGWSAATIAGCLAVLLAAAAAVLSLKGKIEVRWLVAAIEFLSGLVFGVGLAVSGMGRPSKVAGFLDLRSGAWDPSLAFVMGAALVLTFPFFQILELHTRTPLVGGSFDMPPKRKHPDASLVVGSLLFGFGWGVAGACPGPIWMLVFAVPSLEVTMIFVGMLVGTSVWVIWQRVHVPRRVMQVVPNGSGVSNVSIVPEVSGLSDLGIELPVLPGDVALCGGLPKSEAQAVAARFRSWLFLNGEGDPGFHGEEIKKAGCKCQVLACANTNPLPSGMLEALLEATASLPRPLMLQCPSGNWASIVLLLHLANVGRLSPASARQLAVDLDLKAFTRCASECEPMRQWVLREVSVLLSSDDPPSPGVVHSGPDVLDEQEPWLEQLFNPDSGAYSYLLACQATKEAVLIDPVAAHKDRDLALVRSRGFSIKYVLGTHCYTGYEASAEAIRQDAPGVRTVISEASNAEADILVKDGDNVKFGGQSLAVLATPGHTDGCVSLLLSSGGAPRAVFTGHALLIRSCGRTDCQQGDAAELHRSIHTRLFALPGETKVFPGHDGEGKNVSTIQEERLFNPRLVQSEADFVKSMAKLSPIHTREAGGDALENVVCCV